MAAFELKNLGTTKYGQCKWPHGYKNLLALWWYFVGFDLIIINYVNLESDNSNLMPRRTQTCSQVVTRVEGLLTSYISRLLQSN